MKKDNLEFLCPLPFDNFPFVNGSFDSMTLYGYIQKMIKAYDKLIKVVKEHQEFIDNYESQIDEIERQINYLNNKMDSLLVEIDDKFDAIVRDLQNEFSILTNRVIALIDNNYNILKNYIDGKYDDLEEQIQNISIDSIILRDPTTGLMSNVQVVIDNVYNMANVDAISASEYDALELTASDYDAYDITAYDYDTKAKTIFV